MADMDFDEVPASNLETIPAPQIAELPEIKLFGKWSCDDVHVNDMSLQDYIAVKEKNAKYLPHSAGRYAAKRFRKAQCPIVERLTNSLMMHGRNNGKKLMAVRIVKHAFEIIHLLTGENPLQVSEKKNFCSQLLVSYLIPNMLIPYVFGFASGQNQFTNLLTITSLRRVYLKCCIQFHILTC